MGIGFRIKEARERLGLTQSELGKLVGVTGSAITNYEKETSHPKEPIIYKLIDVLDIDANYLFQDMVRSKTNNSISLLEYEYLEKYRSLDDYGKETVRIIIDREYQRIQLSETAPQLHLTGLKDYRKNRSSHSTESYINAAHAIPNAAHEAQAHDEQIMDSEDF